MDFCREQFFFFFFFIIGRKQERYRSLARDRFLNKSSNVANGRYRDSGLEKNFIESSGSSRDIVRDDSSFETHSV